MQGNPVNDMTPMTKEQAMTEPSHETRKCDFCGGVLDDDALVYVRTECFGETFVTLYKHAAHGPFMPLYNRHGTFNHTPRCNTGGCHD